jgi:Tol biopolymer transport system component
VIGTTLAHYQILSRLGSGGMGDVYVAEDTRLHRKVALKVVHAPDASDVSRSARFLREAHAVAALNHPNIVTIHSVEEAGGIHFLTMELVEGKTLEEVIPRGGLPLHELMPLAVALTDAVGAAHSKGITHRDLKPANVMVTPNRRLKVLDFGLARLEQPDRSVDRSATMLPTQLTAEGRILGTVAYMSPEQAEGRPIDHRSDLFSIGIILYQMATGRRPFTGETSMSTLAAIIRDTPPLATDIRPDLPRELARVVGRCLEKDPARRYPNADALLADLQSLQAAVVRDAPSLTRGSPRSPRALRRAAVATAVLAAAIAAIVAGWRVVRTPAPSTGVDVTFSQLTSQSGAESWPSLSPDGKWFVYSSTASGNADIYLQSVGGTLAINLTKDAANDTQPTFSPDGDRVAFRSDRGGGGLFVMERTGERVRRLTDSGYNPDWSPTGDEVVYADEAVITPLDRWGFSALHAVNVASGARRLIVKGDAVQPSWSPHGHRIAYWGLRVGGQRDIWTVPAGGGTALAVTNDAAIDWNPIWSADGRYLYFLSNRGGSMNLWRVPIDEQSGTVQRAPEPVTIPSTNLQHVRMGKDGSHLVYATELGTSNLQRVSFDAVKGAVEGEPQWITRGSNYYNWPSASRDGQWLAFSTQRRQEDIYISRSDGSDVRQLTNDVARDRRPRWSPDGSRIVFFSDRNGVYSTWLINPDGANLVRVSDGVPAIHPDWHPDGQHVVASDILSSVTRTFDVTKPMPQQGELLPAWHGPDPFESLGWSPDGEYLVGDLARDRGGIVIYSARTRQYEQLSEFGFEAIWLNDSRRLIFVNQGKGTLFLLDIRTKAAREILSVGPDDIRTAALSPDGQHLYLARPVADGDVWMATLKPRS